MDTNIDISFLTLEEKEKIFGVLQRDERVRNVDQKRVKTLRRKSVHFNEKKKSSMKIFTGEWAERFAAPGRRFFSSTSSALKVLLSKRIATTPRTDAYVDAALQETKSGNLTTTQRDTHVETSPQETKSGNLTTASNTTRDEPETEVRGKTFDVPGVRSVETENAGRMPDEHAQEEKGALISAELDLAEEVSSSSSSSDEDDLDVAETSFGTTLERGKGRAGQEDASKDIQLVAESKDGAMPNDGDVPQKTERPFTPVAKLMNVDVSASHNVACPSDSFAHDDVRKMSQVVTLRSGVDHEGISETQSCKFQDEVDSLICRPQMKEDKSDYKQKGIKDQECEFSLEEVTKQGDDEIVPTEVQSHIMYDTGTVARDISIVREEYVECIREQFKADRPQVEYPINATAQDQFSVAESTVVQIQVPRYEYTLVDTMIVASNMPDNPHAETLIEKRQNSNHHEVSFGKSPLKTAYLGDEFIFESQIDICHSLESVDNDGQGLMIGHQESREESLILQVPDDVDICMSLESIDDSAISTSDDVQTVSGESSLPVPHDGNRRLSATASDEDSIGDDPLSLVEFLESLPGVDHDQASPGVSVPFMGVTAFERQKSLDSITSHDVVLNVLECLIENVERKEVEDANDLQLITFTAIQPSTVDCQHEELQLESEATESTEQIVCSAWPHAEDGRADMPDILQDIADTTPDEEKSKVIETVHTKEIVTQNKVSDAMRNNVSTDSKQLHVKQNDVTIASKQQPESYAFSTEPEISQNRDSNESRFVADPSAFETAHEENKTDVKSEVITQTEKSEKRDSRDTVIDTHDADSGMKVSVLKKNQINLSEYANIHVEFDIKSDVLQTSTRAEEEQTDSIDELEVAVKQPADSLVCETENESERANEQYRDPIVGESESTEVGEEVECRDDYQHPEPQFFSDQIASEQALEAGAAPLYGQNFTTSQDQADLSHETEHITVDNAETDEDPISERVQVEENDVAHPSIHAVSDDLLEKVVSTDSAQTGREKEIEEAVTSKERLTKSPEPPLTTVDQETASVAPSEFTQPETITSESTQDGFYAETEDHKVPGIKDEGHFVQEDAELVAVKVAESITKNLSPIESLQSIPEEISPENGMQTRVDGDNFALDCGDELEEDSDSHYKEATQTQSKHEVCPVDDVNPDESFEPGFVQRAQWSDDDELGLSDPLPSEIITETDFDESRSEGSSGYEYDIDDIGNSTESGNTSPGLPPSPGYINFDNEDPASFTPFVDERQAAEGRRLETLYEGVQFGYSPVHMQVPTIILSDYDEDMAKTTLRHYLEQREADDSDLSISEDDEKVFRDDSSCASVEVNFDEDNSQPLSLDEDDEGEFKSLNDAMWEEIITETIDTEEGSPQDFPYEPVRDESAKKTNSVLEREEFSSTAVVSADAVKAITTETEKSFEADIVETLVDAKQYQASFFVTPEYATEATSSFDDKTSVEESKAFEAEILLQGADDRPHVTDKHLIQDDTAFSDSIKPATDTTSYLEDNTGDVSIQKPGNFEPEVDIHAADAKLPITDEHLFKGDVAAEQGKLEEYDLLLSTTVVSSAATEAASAADVRLKENAQELHSLVDAAPPDVTAGKIDLKSSCAAQLMQEVNVIGDTYEAVIESKTTRRLQDEQGKPKLPLGGEEIYQLTDKTRESPSAPQAVDEDAFAEKKDGGYQQTVTTSAVSYEQAEKDDKTVEQPSVIEDETSDNKVSIEEGDLHDEVERNDNQEASAKETISEVEDDSNVQLAEQHKIPESTTKRVKRVVKKSKKPADTVKAGVSNSSSVKKKSVKRKVAKKKVEGADGNTQVDAYLEKGGESKEPFLVQDANVPVETDMLVNLEDTATATKAKDIGADERESHPTEISAISSVMLDDDKAANTNELKQGDIGEDNTMEGTAGVTDLVTEDDHTAKDSKEKDELAEPGMQMVPTNVDVIQDKAITDGLFVASSGHGINSIEGGSDLLSLQDMLAELNTYDFADENGAAGTVSQIIEEEENEILMKNVEALEDSISPIQNANSATSLDADVVEEALPAFNDEELVGAGKNTHDNKASDAREKEDTSVPKDIIFKESLPAKVDEASMNIETDPPKNATIAVGLVVTATADGQALSGVTETYQAESIERVLSNLVPGPGVADVESVIGDSNIASAGDSASIHATDEQSSQAVDGVPVDATTRDVSTEEVGSIKSRRVSKKVMRKTKLPDSDDKKPAVKNKSVKRKVIKKTKATPDAENSAQRTSEVSQEETAAESSNRIEDIAASEVPIPITLPHEPDRDIASSETEFQDINVCRTDVETNSIQITETRQEVQTLKMAEVDVQDTEAIAGEPPQETVGREEIPVISFPNQGGDVPEAELQNVDESSIEKLPKEDPKTDECTLHTLRTEGSPETEPLQEDTVKETRAHKAELLNKLQETEPDPDTASFKEASAVYHSDAESVAVEGYKEGKPSSSEASSEVANAATTTNESLSDEQKSISGETVIVTLKTEINELETALQEIKHEEVFKDVEAMSENTFYVNDTKDIGNKVQETEMHEKYDETLDDMLGSQGLKTVQNVSLETQTQVIKEDKAEANNGAEAASLDEEPEIEVSVTETPDAAADLNGSKKYDVLERVMGAVTRKNEALETESSEILASGFTTYDNQESETSTVVSESQDVVFSQESAVHEAAIAEEGKVEVEYSDIMETNSRTMPTDVEDVRIADITLQETEFEQTDKSTEVEIIGDETESTRILEEAFLKKLPIAEPDAQNSERQSESINIVPISIESQETESDIENKTLLENESYVETPAGEEEMVEILAPSTESHFAITSSQQNDQADIETRERLEESEEHKFKRHEVHAQQLDTTAEDGIISTNDQQDTALVMNVGNDDNNRIDETTDKGSDGGVETSVQPEDIKTAESPADFLEGLSQKVIGDETSDSFEPISQPEKHFDEQDLKESVSGNIKVAETSDKAEGKLASAKTRKVSKIIAKKPKYSDVESGVKATSTKKKSVKRKVIKKRPAIQETEELNDASVSNVTEETAAIPEESGAQTLEVIERNQDDTISDNTAILSQDKAEKVTEGRHEAEHIKMLTTDQTLEDSDSIYEKAELYQQNENDESDALNQDRSFATDTALKSSAEDKAQNYEIDSTATDKNVIILDDTALFASAQMAGSLPPEQESEAALADAPLQVTNDCAESMGKDVSEKVSIVDLSEDKPSTISDETVLADRVEVTLKLKESKKIDAEGGIETNTQSENLADQKCIDGIIEQPLTEKHYGTNSEHSQLIKRTSIKRKVLKKRKITGDSEEEASPSTTTNVSASEKVNENASNVLSETAEQHEVDSNQVDTTEGKTKLDSGYPIIDSVPTSEQPVVEIEGGIDAHKTAEMVFVQDVVTITELSADGNGPSSLNTDQEVEPLASEMTTQHYPIQAEASDIFVTKDENGGSDKFIAESVKNQYESVIQSTSEHSMIPAEATGITGNTTEVDVTPSEDDQALTLIAVDQEIKDVVEGEDKGNKIDTEDEVPQAFSNFVEEIQTSSKSNEEETAFAGSFQEEENTQPPEEVVVDALGSEPKSRKTKKLSKKVIRKLKDGEGEKHDDGEVPAAKIKSIRKKIIRKNKDDYGTETHEMSVENSRAIQKTEEPCEKSVPVCEDISVVSKVSGIPAHGEKLKATESIQESANSDSNVIVDKEIPIALNDNNAEQNKDIPDEAEFMKTTVQMREEDDTTFFGADESSQRTENEGVLQSVAIISEHSLTSVEAIGTTDDQTDLTAPPSKDEILASSAVDQEIINVGKAGDIDNIVEARAEVTQVLSDLAQEKPTSGESNEVETTSVLDEPSSTPLEDVLLDTLRAGPKSRKTRKVSKKIVKKSKDDESEKHGEGEGPASKKKTVRKKVVKKSTTDHGTETQESLSRIDVADHSATLRDAQESAELTLANTTTHTSEHPSAPAADDTESDAQLIEKGAERVALIEAPSKKGESEHSRNVESSSAEFNKDVTSELFAEFPLAAEQKVARGTPADVQSEQIIDAQTDKNQDPDVSPFGDKAIDEPDQVVEFAGLAIGTDSTLSKDNTNESEYVFAQLAAPETSQQQISYPDSSLEMPSTNEKEPSKLIDSNVPVEAEEASTTQEISITPELKGDAEKGIKDGDSIGGESLIPEMTPTIEAADHSLDISELLASSKKKTRVSKKVVKKPKPNTPQADNENVSTGKKKSTTRKVIKRVKDATNIDRQERSIYFENVPDTSVSAEADVVQTQHAELDIVNEAGIEHEIEPKQPQDSTIFSEFVENAAEDLREDRSASTHADPEIENVSRSSAAVGDEKQKDGQGLESTIREPESETDMALIPEPQDHVLIVEQKKPDGVTEFDHRSDMPSVTDDEGERFLTASNEVTEQVAENVGAEAVPSHQSSVDVPDTETKVIRKLSKKIVKRQKDPSKGTISRKKSTKKKVIKTNANSEEVNKSDDILLVEGKITDEIGGEETLESTSVTAENVPKEEPQTARVRAFNTSAIENVESENLIVEDSVTAPFEEKFQELAVQKLENNTFIADFHVESSSGAVVLEGNGDMKDHQKSELDITVTSETQSELLVVKQSEVDQVKKGEDQFYGEIPSDEVDKSDDNLIADESTVDQVRGEETLGPFLLAAENISPEEAQTAEVQMYPTSGTKNVTEHLASATGVTAAIDEKVQEVVFQGVSDSQADGSSVGDAVVVEGNENPNDYVKLEDKQLDEVDSSIVGPENPVQLDNTIRDLQWELDTTANPELQNETSVIDKNRLDQAKEGEDRFQTEMSSVINDEGDECYVASSNAIEQVAETTDAELPSSADAQDIAPKVIRKISKKMVKKSKDASSAAVSKKKSTKRKVIKRNAKSDEVDENDDNPIVDESTIEEIREKETLEVSLVIAENDSIEEPQAMEVPIFSTSGKENVIETLSSSTGATASLDEKVLEQAVQDLENYTLISDSHAECSSAVAAHGDEYLEDETKVVDNRSAAMDTLENIPDASQTALKSDEVQQEAKDLPTGSNQKVDMLPEVSAIDEEGDLGNTSPTEVKEKSRMVSKKIKKKSKGEEGSVKSVRRKVIKKKVEIMDTEDQNAAVGDELSGTHEAESKSDMKVEDTVPKSLFPSEQESELRTGESAYEPTYLNSQDLTLIPSYEAEIKSGGDSQPEQVATSVSDGDNAEHSVAPDETTKESNISEAMSGFEIDASSKTVASESGPETKKSRKLSKRVVKVPKSADKLGDEANESHPTKKKSAKRKVVKKIKETGDAAQAVSKLLNKTGVTAEDSTPEAYDISAENIKQDGHGASIIEKEDNMVTEEAAVELIKIQEKDMAVLLEVAASSDVGAKTTTESENDDISKKIQDEDTKFEQEAKSEARTDYHEHLSFEQRSEAHHDLSQGEALEIEIRDDHTASSEVFPLLNDEAVSSADVTSGEQMGESKSTDTEPRPRIVQKMTRKTVKKSKKDSGDTTPAKAKSVRKKVIRKNKDNETNASQKDGTEETASQPQDDDKTAEPRTDEDPKGDSTSAPKKTSKPTEELSEEDRTTIPLVQGEVKHLVTKSDAQPHETVTAEENKTKESDDEQNQIQAQSADEDVMVTDNQAATSPKPAGKTLTRHVSHASIELGVATGDANEVESSKVKKGKIVIRKLKVAKSTADETNGSADSPLKKQTVRRKVVAKHTKGAISAEEPKTDGNQVRDAEVAEEQSAEVGSTTDGVVSAKDEVDAGDTKLEEITEQFSTPENEDMRNRDTREQVDDDIIRADSDAQTGKIDIGRAYQEETEPAQPSTKENQDTADQAAASQEDAFAHAPEDEPTGQGPPGEAIAVRKTRKTVKKIKKPTADEDDKSPAKKATVKRKVVKKKPAK